VWEKKLRIGSSPRAWGTPPAPRLSASAARFIPTCMGNSRSRRLAPIIPSVHPHVHGELPVQRGCQVAGDGSSPRAWGTPQVPRALPLRIRFIPTCMGNSSPL